MESRSYNLESQKQKIIDFIEINGPSIPMKISNYIKVDSLIASAMLSELLSDKKLKISNLRVGNSPVYYLKGQEFQLENFVIYLGGKEREAFELLRERKVLKDEKMHPAIRVALRSIKDFAFPIDNNNQIFWRFLKISDQQAFDMIYENKADAGEEKIIVTPKAVETILDRKPEVFERGIEIGFDNKLKKEGVEIEKRKAEFVESAGEVVLGVLEKKVESIEELKEKPVIVKSQRVSHTKSKFLDVVSEFLAKENILVVENIKRGKKDYIAVVGHSVDGNKTNYLCIAKDKKLISDKELMKNLQEGRKRNLPVLFISPGDASKKAIEWLDYLGNLIIYKKID